MEDSHEVLQHHVGFYGRYLVVGLFLHVAVDYLLFFECLKEFITRF